MSYGSYKFKREEILKIVEAGCTFVQKPSEPIFTNDLKKGDIIAERNGWIAEMWDNCKGDTRVANVFGYCEEAGSIYSTDIIAVYKNNAWYSVTKTAKQLDNAKMRRAMGF